jgi:hypothetical protein
VEEAPKSLRHAAAGAPSHGPARLLRRRRVELPRCSRVGIMWPPGCCEQHPLRLHEGSRGLEEVNSLF